jgi:hypothetical protein
MAKGYSDPGEKPYRRHPGDDFWMHGVHGGSTSIKATAAS